MRLTHRLSKLEKRPLTTYEQVCRAFAAIPPISPGDAAAVRRFLYALPGDELRENDVDIALAWSDGALAWARRRFGEPAPDKVNWQDEVVRLAGAGEITAEDARVVWPGESEMLARIERRFGADSGTRGTVRTG